MFSKFNVILDDYFYNKEINQHLSLGHNIYSRNQKMIYPALKKYILPGGALDGTKMRQDWFPQQKYDVFLSHSHKDINKVKAFAGWLSDVFGLQCFIDSSVWGYSDDLLKKIDDRYCLNKSSHTYDYQTRNYSTSHVHMMLSTALEDMMDHCECLMFLNTPSSISVEDNLKHIKSGHKTKELTSSPWIYQELSLSRLLRIQIPDRIKAGRMTYEQRSKDLRNECIDISYDVSSYLTEMRELDCARLEAWKKAYNPNGRNALDALYRLNGLLKIL